MRNVSVYRMMMPSSPKKNFAKALAGFRRAHDALDGLAELHAGRGALEVPPARSTKLAISLPMFAKRFGGLVLGSIEADFCKKICV